MIRESTLFCKLIRIKSSSKSLFNSFMDGFCPELQTCPCCGTKGDCQILAYYDRSLVDFINGAPVCHSVCIVRLICTCGHTHAVLPDFIIPYSSYGLFFILRTLAEYFLHISTVEKLCDRFSISRSQLYRWLDLFQMQKEEWISMVDSMEISSFSFLKALLIHPAYSDFAGSFICCFEYSFLQSHKNMVDYCQHVFST